MLRQKEHHTYVLTARDAAANTPLDGLDFTSEPAFGKPPSLLEPSLEWGTW